MGTRVQLQSLLENILGSRNVYFQPPESVKLCYPCIIYSRNKNQTWFADDKPYNHQIQYTLIIIDSNPDSLIPGKIADLPMCTYDRRYNKDNLNHEIYNLYY